jgi:hypothetical protein
MEHVMKLSSEKLESVLEQIDVKVIPDDHPSLPKQRPHLSGLISFDLAKPAVPRLRLIGISPDPGR